MREIALSRPGYVALVDDEDYELVSSYKWHADVHDHTTYARANVVRGGKKTSIRMHTLIVNGVTVDHVDHNGLNNQRSNLRPASEAENGRNHRKPNIITASQFKGVSLTRAGNWRAHIVLDSTQHNLGVFSTEEEAATAYNIAARRLHGEFAQLNDVVEVELPDRTGQGIERRRITASSLFNGVSWDASRKKWASYINLPGGKKRYLGRYILEIDAAKAYNEAALEVYGDRAILNTIEGETDAQAHPH